MINHHDWNQYKHILPAIKEAKLKVQEVLKPGGGGLNSTNIGKDKEMSNHLLSRAKLIRV